MTGNFKYQGNELELFQHASRWKKYFCKEIKPYIKKKVLEVGAGIGSTTLLLNNGSAENWLMLEPDPAMAASLQTKIENKEFPSNCQLHAGTIDQLKTNFDTIIYIDVLEHIEADGAEMKKAAALLNPGGHVIVLSPAFPSLYSPFDRAIGHYRRYTKGMLKKITPIGLQFVSCKYYDSVGYFAALANKLLLRKQYPTQNQVLFWDNWMIPLSRITDRIFFHRFGKSIIATWKKE